MYKNTGVTLSVKLRVKPWWLGLKDSLWGGQKWSHTSFKEVSGLWEIWARQIEETTSWNKVCLGSRGVDTPLVSCLLTSGRSVFMTFTQMKGLQKWSSVFPSGEEEGWLRARAPEAGLLISKNPTTLHFGVLFSEPQHVVLLCSQQ